MSDKEESRLPPGVKPLDDDEDYFLKQAEFRVWLREAKNKVRSTCVQALLSVLI